MKNIELKVLSELMRNSRRSDRELAKAIGVSQPTVSRAIKKLEKEHKLRYTAIPDLSGLGFQILAFTFINRRGSPPQIQKGQDFIRKHHNQIVFASSGTGTGIDRIVISGHKTYSDYSTLMRDLGTEWGNLMEITGSFLVSLATDNILRHLSLHYLFQDMNELKKET